ncbi:MAG TPA: hypothetical protein DF383_12835 [Deltaproteobacteria bacterium]|nr:hypothetical protein [Deltaproteobacteria bacterium]
MRKSFFTALLLSLSLIFGSCGKGGKKDHPQATDKVFNVSVAEVVSRQIPDALEISGVFAPIEKLTVKSDFSGKVQALSAVEGQQISSGDTLLKIEDEKLPYVLDRQRAELREAEAQYDLDSRLNSGNGEAPPAAEVPEEIANPPEMPEEAPPGAEEGFPTERPPGAEAQEAFDNPAAARRDALMRRAAMLRQRMGMFGRPQAPPIAPPANPEVAESRLNLDQAKIDRLKAEIALSERQLAGSTLLATLDGFIAKVNITEGAMVKNDEELLEIVKIDPIELVLQVPVGDIGRLDKRMNVTVSVKGFGQEVSTGEISFIGAEVDPNKKSLEVRVRIPNPGLHIKAGMEAIAHLAVANRTHLSLLIPPNAIRREGDKDFVYRLDGQVAEKREIETGGTVEGMVEAKEGLKSGDRVVTQGIDQLKAEEEFVKVVF